MHNAICPFMAIACWNCKKKKKHYTNTQINKYVLLRAFLPLLWKIHETNLNLQETRNLVCSSSALLCISEHSASHQYSLMLMHSEFWFCDWTSQRIYKGVIHSHYHEPSCFLSFNSLCLNFFSFVLCLCIPSISPSTQQAQRLQDCSLRTGWKAKIKQNREK